jgi:uncharacterized protein YegP (UPF0339 family)
MAEEAPKFIFIEHPDGSMSWSKPDTPDQGNTIRFRVFEDEDGSYKWSMRNPNGKSSSVSREAFSRKGNAIRACERMIDLVLECTTVRLEGVDR